jgi:hypothetical protein
MIFRKQTGPNPCGMTGVMLVAFLSSNLSDDGQT